MKSKTLETFDDQYLKSIMKYDEGSGIFEWKRSLPGCSAGSVAGGVNGEGYIKIMIDRKSYLGHRLAWLYVNGEWPNGHIDHIDGNRTNNAIANLRVVSNSLNMQNQRVAKRGTKSGLLGVSYSRPGKPWRAVISSKEFGKKSLGSFDSKEEAHEAYLAAKRQLHASCTI